MDATNNTIHDRQSKIVKEDVNDAVINEQVRPQQHEEVTAAVDKDVHQDHHHTTVQPVKAQETLTTSSPAQHHQNVAPTQNKTVEHGNERDTRQALDREAAQFKNTSTTQQTTHSQSSTTAPVANSERVHHHVHEHVQPVVEKETIQPHVVHTTVPVHETHHAEAIHHGTSVLPTKTLGELERGSGSGGVNATGQGYGLEDDRRHHDHQHSSGQAVRETGRGATGGAAAATHGQRHNGGRDVDARGVNDRGVGQTEFDERRTRQQEPQLGSSAVSAGGAGAGTGAGATGTGTAGAAQTAARTAHAKSHNTSSTTTDHSHTADATSGKKPSMAAKLNPFKDADGDGHKGFMT
ncbi:allergen [Colletotrichum incanum]|uniref:Allergen n=1 Tax=Colletotrichum incanum TaxID=1573173 RepID=A0A161Y1A6_COLIC|nr:allergen [Colletotrichum incanum]